MVETVTAVEFYGEPLRVVAFVGGWLVAMVTGIFFTRLVS